MRRKGLLELAQKYFCQDASAMALRAVVWREEADQKLMYF